MEKYEKDARKNWDVFYKNNQDKFFKDRHYFAREFPHIFPEGADVGGGGDDESDGPALEASDGKDAASTSRPSAACVDHGFDPDARETGPAPRYVRPGTGDVPHRKRVFLEVGCGVGNTAFPLLALDDTAVVYCCDFSKRAVDLVRARRDALPTRAQRDRIVPFVCDITNEPLTDVVPIGSVDVCTMVFVLSAVSPEKMRDAVRNVSSVMRPGAEARVLIRDYASGDLAQERFAAKAGQKLAENFYVRGDGTRAFYFSPETLKALFAGAGMALERLDVHQRAITNRGQNVKMDRRWVQASFASARVPAEPLPPPPPPPEPEWAKRAREAEARRAEAAAHAEAEAADRREREAASWAEVTAAVETCARGDLERLVLGMVREGVVAPETLVRRLKEASDEGEGRRLQKET